MATHLDATHYHELVHVLLTGSMDENDRENAIKIALGELADLWPERIRRDRHVELHGLSI